MTNDALTIENIRLFLSSQWRIDWGIYAESLGLEFAVGWNFSIQLEHLLDKQLHEITNNNL